MKYRLLCSVLALAMVCASWPTLAFADQDQDAMSQPLCVCDTLCAEDAVNTDCPVCRTDLLACIGTDPGATPSPDQSEPNGPAVAPLQEGILPYMDGTGALQSYTGPYTDVAAGNWQWSDGWYLAAGEVTLYNRILVSGNVNLILADGASLTASDGIQVAEGSSLTIWAQSMDEATMGRLAATSYTHAAIGGNSGSDGGNGGDGGSGGTITIAGGIVSASSIHSADIGGGDGGVGGPGENGGNGGTDPAGSPQTGDTGNMGLWLALLTASILVLILTGVKRKRT